MLTATRVYCKAPTTIQPTPLRRHNTQSLALNKMMSRSTRSKDKVSSSAFSADNDNYKEPAHNLFKNKNKNRATIAKVFVFDQQKEDADDNIFLGKAIEFNPKTQRYLIKFTDGETMYMTGKEYVGKRYGMYSHFAFRSIITQLIFLFFHFFRFLFFHFSESKTTYKFFYKGLVKKKEEEKVERAQTNLQVKELADKNENSLTELNELNDKHTLLKELSLKNESLVVKFSYQKRELEDKNENSLMGLEELNNNKNKALMSELASEHIRCHELGLKELMKKFSQELQHKDMLSFRIWSPSARS
jgi:hypothetical protein